MLLTIFTPAYNRANLLHRLYNSLCLQTFCDFEWIIVDDGSVDDTSDVIAKFIEESKISIIYYRQENSGKHIAINKGVDLAKGELFFIVDSDDYLPENALSIIKEKYDLTRSTKNIAGVCGRKGLSKDIVIGNNYMETNFFSNSLDIRYKYKVQGDLSEVVKTDILREFPFPSINEEKFLTEGLIWFRIAKKYNFLFFSEIIYIAEYQENGLSKSSFNVRKNSPEGAMLFYKELQLMPISLLYKIRANINYWRFAQFSKRTFVEKWVNVKSFYSLIGLPLSFLFILKILK